MASPETLCLQIYRDLMRHAQDLAGNGFRVCCHPEVAEQLQGGSRAVVEMVEKKTGVSVHVIPDPAYHPEQFDIVEMIRKKAENPVDSPG